MTLPQKRNRPDAVSARRAGRLLVQTAALVITLSGAGAVLSGIDLNALVALPPLPRTRETPPFNPWLFASVLAALLGLLLPFFLPAVRGAGRLGASRRPFPRWGYGAVLLTAVAWLVAWTRIPFLAPIQHHTFLPLWLGYIGIAEALLVRAGQPASWQVFSRRYLFLYPMSALFWWSYEWLNRIVENWTYLGVSHFSPGEYIFLASLSFSTVLPAIVATARLLDRYLPNAGALRRHAPLRLGRRAERALLFASLLVLVLLPFAPDQLYALLWVAPLVYLLLAEKNAGLPGYFADMEQGRWDRIVVAASAGLCCGFFWELWNLASLAKWIYHVPYLGGLHLFEMPLLGFAGYIPFGVLCLAVSRLVLGADPLSDNDAAPAPDSPHSSTRQAEQAVSLDARGR